MQQPFIDEENLLWATLCNKTKQLRSFQNIIKWNIYTIHCTPLEVSHLNLIKQAVRMWKVMDKKMNTYLLKQSAIGVHLSVSFALKPCMKMISLLLHYNCWGLHEPRLVFMFEHVHVSVEEHVIIQQCTPVCPPVCPTVVGIYIIYTLKFT